VYALKFVCVRMFACTCVCVCVCVRVGGSLAEHNKLALLGLSVLFKMLVHLQGTYTSHVQIKPTIQSW
jgi:hypothetical protein